MYRKLFFFTSFVLMLALAGTNATFGAVVWEGRIVSQNDDAEESITNAGAIDLGSSDLEMPYENAGKGNNQIIGIRFTNVNVPKGANVTNAYVEFTCDETKDGTLAVSLLIDGEKVPNAAQFAGGTNNISTRGRTTAKVVWTPVNWTVIGQKDKTSEITSVIREIINQDGWVNGNALVLFVRDDPAKPSQGTRCADSFSDAATAPLLHIEFTTKYASNPVPADGATVADTWVSLGWDAGETTVSHDVYMSDNKDDVAKGAAAAFRGNQPLPLFLAGLGLPGDPYPTGLTPGTTYYWRVDEVEANGTTKYQGPVWSFWIPPRTAYNPLPPDGAYFTDLATKLSWTPGFGAKLHTVYFGASLDTVSNATTGGVPQGVTTYTPPGPLVLNKTYYWRVDEFDGATTLKGNVWSFTTTIAGLGTAVMERWENINGTALSALKSDPRYPNNPTVTETVTRFSWDGPDTDNYGARISGWLYVPATGDYTFWLNTDDNGELWLSTDDDPANIRLIAQETNYTNLNVWNDGTQRSQPIRLVAGQKYYIAALWKEGGGGDHCQVAWRGPGIPTLTIIPGSNLSSQPFSAYGALPANGATGVKQSPTLRWKRGLKAASHELYFGTDAAAVRNATKTSPEYKGTKALGAENHAAGTLAWATSYYWRVDEVNNTNAASPWVGSVWSFTTADFAVIDDFEGYTDNDKANEAIWQTWIDGFGTTTNGAVVGNNLPPYAERTIVHGGRQAMPVAYNNSGTARNSEAQLPLTFPRDWTVDGVTVLSLWYYGNSANSSERMYVSIANRTGTPAVVYNDVTDATTVDVWRRWVVPLQDFANQGINLKDVDKFVIGFGTKGSTAAGGTGQLYIDDIGLYRAASEPETILLEAEAGTITAPMKTYNDPLASGGKYIGTDDGSGDESANPPATGIATYNITVLGGVYKVALRVKPDLGNSLWVRIVGATNYSPGTHSSGWIRFNDIAAGAQWHWDEVHSNDHGNAVVSITLPAGAHTLEIARREDGAQVDAILIMAVQ